MGQWIKSSRSARKEEASKEGFQNWFKMRIYFNFKTRLNVLFIICILKIVLGIIFFSIFLLHVWDQVGKHISGKTTKQEENIPVHSLRLPHLTFCSKKPYKKPGYFFNESSFVTNTYSFEEIFHPSTIEYMKQKNFVVKRIASQFRGMCYTLISNHTFEGSEYGIVSMSKQFPHDVEVIAHAPGEEFWMIADAWPKFPSTEKLSKSSDCVVRKKVKISIQDPDNGRYCKDWSPKEFFGCAKLKLIQHLKDEKFYCSVTWWSQYFPKGTPECQFHQDLQEIKRLDEWMDSPVGFPLKFPSLPKSFGCPNMCEQEYYSIRCREFQQENEFGISFEGVEETKGIEFWFFYQSSEIELEQETFLYDFSGIVASVGGSLGLFLGFSCFQVASWMIDFIYKQLNEWHSSRKSICN